MDRNTITSSNFERKMGEINQRIFGTASRNVSINEPQDTQSGGDDEQDQLQTTPLFINNGWNDNNEKIVISIGENAMSYKWMHQQSASFFSFAHNGLSVLVIMLSTSLSVESVIAGLEEDPGLKLYRQIAIYIITILTVVMNFLKLEQRSANHRTQSAKFSDVYRSVQQKISVYRRERGNAKDYISDIMKKYDDYTKEGPDINRLIISRFKRTFRGTKIALPTVVDNMPKLEAINEGNTQIIDMEPASGIATNNLREMSAYLQIEGEITDKQEEDMDTDTRQKLNEDYVKKKVEIELGKYTVPNKESEYARYITGRYTNEH